MSLMCSLPGLSNGGSPSFPAFPPLSLSPSPSLSLLHWFAAAADDLRYPSLSLSLTHPLCLSLNNEQPEGERERRQSPLLPHKTQEHQGVQESFLTTTTTCRERGGKRERKEKERKRQEEREGGKWKRRGENKQTRERSRRQADGGEDGSDRGGGVEDEGD